MVAVFAGSVPWMRPAKRQRGTSAYGECTS